MSYMFIIALFSMNIKKLFGMGFGGGGQESHRYGDITHLELNEDHTFSNFLFQEKNGQ